MRWLLTALDSFFDLALRANAFIANDEVTVVELQVPWEQFRDELRAGMISGHTVVAGQKYVVKGNFSKTGFWVGVLPESTLYGHLMMWSHICFRCDQLDGNKLQGSYQFFPARREFYVFGLWLLFLALAAVPMLFVLRDGFGLQLLNLEAVAIIVVPGCLAFLALKWMMARVFRAMDCGRTRALTEAYVRSLARPSV